jgi:hypothetical protein
VVFFSFATNKILSTRKGRVQRAMEMGAGELEKVLDNEGEVVKPQDYIQE